LTHKKRDRTKGGVTQDKEKKKSKDCHQLERGHCHQSTKWEDDPEMDCRRKKESYGQKAPKRK